MKPKPYVAAIAAAALLGLSACAPYPVTPAGQAMPMARMDEHMTAMRGMHERMAGARTAEERNALMAEHHKLMQDGMGMMGGMGPVPRRGMGGMMDSPGPMGDDPAARQQWMEKRMEMMQSMMQMMMDRLPPAPAKP